MYLQKIDLISKSSVVRVALLALMLVGTLLALDGGQAFGAATASISGGPSSGNAPLTVTLTGSGSPASDTGCPAATYTWDFADGSPAGSGQSVTHTYNTSGDFNVTLTYTRYVGFFNPFGSFSCSPDQATATKLIKVFVLATPTVTVTMSASPTSGTAPLHVTFSASGSPPSESGCPAATYSWDFDDGGSSATGPSTSHTYAAAGSYHPTVTYTMYFQSFPFCNSTSAQDSKTITVSPPTTPPTVTISANPTSGIAPFTVNYSATGSPPSSPSCSPATYAWSLRDPNGTLFVLPGGPSGKYTFTNPGTYTLIVKFTTNQATGGPCIPGEATDSKTISVTAPSVPPVVVLAVDPTSGQAPLTVKMAAEGKPLSESGCPAESISWDFGDHTTTTTGDPGSLIHAYTAAGTYTVKVTFTTYFQGFPFCNSQQATDSKTITVTAPPSSGGGSGGGGPSAPPPPGQPQPPPPSPGPSPTSACNSEFSSSVLESSFTRYIPKSGPTLSLTTNPGHLRMELPATATFDHWLFSPGNGVDEAPQLRCSAPSGNWEMTTSVKVLSPTTQANYHAGLMVVFSQFDVFYWGIYQGAEIRLERSGSRPGISADLASPTSEVELMIAKSGNTYFFSYRLSGGTTWNAVGQITTPETPQFVGLIGKAWSPINLTVDFDYLRVNPAR